MDQLYAILEGIPFAAGHPLLIRKGPRDLIVWPQMDPMNQVQIIRRRKGFYCIRSRCPAGPHRRPKTLWGTIWNQGLAAAIDETTLVRCDCEAMACRVAQQINGLGL